jgi:SAM-dependent methyltransferase
MSQRKSIYLQSNSDYWAQAIYDNPNPESYVFRIFGRVLSQEFHLNGQASEKLLDFGCGSGGNMRFFHSKGFDVFGVDQSAVDIARCKVRIPEKAAQFLTISPESFEDDLWFPNVTFDVITAFQVLYYLSNSDLELRVRSLHRMLKPGGIFIATMMSKSSWYYDMSSPFEDGLRLVKFHRDQDIGRPGLVLNNHYINFTEDAEELKQKFNQFKPVHYRGFYDGIYRDDQGSEKHLVFIGMK